MCLLGYKIIFAWWAHITVRAEWRRVGWERRFFTVSAIQISSAYGKRTKKDVPFGIQNNIYLVGTYRPQSGVAAGNAGSLPPAPYKYHRLAVNASKKVCLLRYIIARTGWAHSALRAEWRNGGRAARDVGSSPRAPYKYHPLAVNAPIKMCLLGYKIIFAWWAHIALRAEWRRVGWERRFFTVSAIQISSACGKRTKKDVPLGVQNNICLVGTYRRQSGVAAGEAGSSP
jgi:hypothetical protein